MFKVTNRNTKYELFLIFFFIFQIFPVGIYLLKS